LKFFKDCEINEENVQQYIDSIIKGKFFYKYYYYNWLSWEYEKKYSNLKNYNN